MVLDGEGLGGLAELFSAGQDCEVCVLSDDMFEQLAVFMVCRL